MSPQPAQGASRTRGGPRSRGRPATYRRVGILAILGLVVITYAVFVKRVPFVHGYRIQGVFSSSNHLRKGSPVRIAGVDVGKVTSMSGGPGTTALVTMEISDAGRPIHTDATLKVRSRVFLEGGFFVELRPGSPRAPVLRDSGTIPLPQTAIPVQADQLLAALNRPTRESFNRTVNEVATGLEGGGAEALHQANLELAPTLKDVAVISEAARGTAPHDLSNLIGSTARVTSALASREGQLADLITSLNRTSGALASQDRALAESVRQLDGVLQVAPGALSALDRALPPLTRFARAIRPGLRIAPPILDDATRVLVELDALVRPSARGELLTLLRLSLTDLPTFEQKLAGLFRVTKPVTDCTSNRVLPALYSQVDDGPLSTGRPVWQDFLHGLVGLGSASQNFDGNGPAVRYLFGGGNQLVSTGDTPGIGQLFGRTADPVLGSRPLWLGPGVKPPLRPDQDCSHQAAPQLTARSSLRETTRTVPGRVSRESLLRGILSAGRVL
ncbi:MAG: phospholipid/cholesterol/gamma-HCH transport system substrate-binding protein [Solirubrobacteraceae bacterium]|jgi:virulence factor Mce-like protein|nr:phospholipid/cholesterol/gamma-HCH transport system substrate-binding protein [Solirubrobacteraceae bacterium]